jgi:hypothetical protein
MPGESKALPFFVPHEKLGLTLVSDVPIPEIAARTWRLSLTPGEPASVGLEYFDRYELSVYAVMGVVEMTIGPGGGGGITISPGEAHTGRYTYARCPSATFVSDGTASGGNAVVKVKQEAVARKEPLRKGAF